MHLSWPCAVLPLRSGSGWSVLSIAVHPQDCSTRNLQKGCSARIGSCWRGGGKAAIVAKLCAVRTELLLQPDEFEEVLTMLHSQQCGRSVGGGRRGYALTQRIWQWFSKPQRERPPPPAKPPPDEEEDQHVEKKIGHGSSCEVCGTSSGVFYSSVV